MKKNDWLCEVCEKQPATWTDPDCTPRMCNDCALPIGQDTPEWKNYFKNRKKKVEEYYKRLGQI